MEQYVYIKKSIFPHFVDFAEALKPEEYNNLGETYQDYLDNKWVLLSDAQVAYLEEHENADVKEVWDMAPAQKTLEQAKMEKLMQIDQYDRSNNVNSFTINGKQMWLSYTQRQQLKTSVEAYNATGAETVTKWFDGQEYTFPVATWLNMLAQLEVYAGEAKNVTDAHIAAVDSLNTIEEVEVFDYTAGYPQKLVF